MLLNLVCFWISVLVLHSGSKFWHGNGKLTVWRSVCYWKVGSFTISILASGNCSLHIIEKCFLEKEKTSTNHQFLGVPAVSFRVFFYNWQANHPVNMSSFQPPSWLHDSWVNFWPFLFLWCKNQLVHYANHIKIHMLNDPYENPDEIPYENPPKKIHPPFTVVTQPDSMVFLFHQRNAGR